MTLIGPSRRLASAPRCPSCRRTLDGYAMLGGDLAPTPGDITICGYCGELMIFDGDPLVLRRPTGREYAELTADPVFVVQLAEARNAVEAFQRTMSQGGPGRRLH